MADPKDDPSAYFESLTLELRSRAARVRHLIGPRHFLSDGHHKEYVLKDLIARHLPSGARVARGFVRRARPTPDVSREQDLLIVDTSRNAPLFAESDLLISQPDTILSCISVKSTASSGSVLDCIDTLDSAARVLGGAGLDLPCTCFFGGLFLTSDSVYPNTILQWFVSACSEKVGKGIGAWAHASPWAFALDGQGIVTVRRAISPDHDGLELHFYPRPDTCTALLLAQLYTHVSENFGGAVDESPFSELAIDDGDGFSAHMKI